MLSNVSLFAIFLRGMMQKNKSLMHSIVGFHWLYWTWYLSKLVTNTVFGIYGYILGAAILAKDAGTLVTEHFIILI